MLTQTAQHALRALLYLARQPEGAVVAAGRMAEATGSPARYLAKTLQGLASAGLVRGTRGREGGYALAVPAASLRVADVIAAFETGESPQRCLLGDQPCQPERPCAAHVRWREAQLRATESVGRIRLLDLLSGLATLDDESLAVRAEAGSEWFGTRARAGTVQVNLIER